MILCVNLVFLKFFLCKIDENHVQRVAICLHNRRGTFFVFLEKRSLHVTLQILQKRLRFITFVCVFVLFWSKFDHFFGQKIGVFQPEYKWIYTRTSRYQRNRHFYYQKNYVDLTPRVSFADHCCGVIPGE
mgnify:CR=1 FL=1